MRNCTNKHMPLHMSVALEMLTCAIVNRWGYPKGDAEQFLYDTIPVLQQLGFGKVYWIHFSSNGSPTTQDNRCTFIHAGKFSEDKLIGWLLSIRPSFVHHQGDYRQETVRCCNKLSVPVLTEEHYWNGYGHLGPKHNMQRIVDKLVFPRVAIYAPWSDQGLGIQARAYAKALYRAGYKPSILSFAPYSGYSSQREPQEWTGYDVVYSKHNREQVTDDEVVNFLSSRQVDKLLIPEIVLHRVFEIASLASKAGVKTYAIPNIEIVRKTELDKFKVFDKVLCNNNICYSLLARNGVHNLRKIAFSPLVDVRASPPQGKVRFLCVGGLNSVVRKKVLQVVQAFAKTDINAILDVRIQGGQKPANIEQYSCDRIRVVARHSTYKEVLQSYLDAAITIHVSSHEGLGIGFYESISLGRPVITLDTPPHNEVIQEGVSGWLVGGFRKRPMQDNKQGLMQEVVVDVYSLAETISRAYREYTSNPQAWFQSVLDYYNDNFSPNKFQENFVDALL